MSAQDPRLLRFLRGNSLGNLIFAADGRAIASRAVDAFPTCSADWAGAQLRLPGGAGVADQVAVCHKDAADAWVWTDALSGPTGPGAGAPDLAFSATAAAGLSAGGGVTLNGAFASSTTAFPAGALAAGSVVRARGLLNLSVSGVGSRTVTLFLQFNPAGGAGIDAARWSGDVVGAGSVRWVFFEATVHVRAAGASGSFWSYGVRNAYTAATSPTAEAAGNASFTTAATAIDTTDAHDLEVWLTAVQAGGSNTISATLQWLQVEHLTP